MSTKKALPDDINNFFKGESVFFQAPPKPQPAPLSNSQTVTVMEHPNETPAARHSPALAGQDRMQQSDEEQEAVVNQIDATSEESNNDVTTSAITSSRQGIDLKKWQEIIENTETQNSALRLTSQERYAIEDAVNELRRKYGIKTSMNEMARLGLLVIVADFKKRRKDSLIYTVKKA